MDEIVLFLIIFGAVVLFLTCCFVVLYFTYIKNPFIFPYLEISFDVSGTRQPRIEDYVDKYLIQCGTSDIDHQITVLEQWTEECEVRIKKSLFKKRRIKQYNKIYDESNMYVFIFTRKRTRYKQSNYVRYPYEVIETVKECACSYEYLIERYQELKSIHFEATLSDYHSTQQRRLMTKELRNEIAIRDNYTCQICGKYMPDGVGLHIDHIIPVSKGGKSVPSNLQVLCSKCNGSKSSK